MNNDKKDHGKSPAKSANVLQKQSSDTSQFDSIASLDTESQRLIKPMTNIDDAESCPSMRPIHVRLWETLRYFGPLGLTAFGGPAAHIAMLHTLFVEKLQWLDDKMFSEVFAIGQALPGPSSTQMTFIIAIHRNGLLPAIFAFILWSLPGLVVMTSLAVSSIYVTVGMASWQIALRSGLCSVAIGLVAAAGLKLSSNIIKNNVDIILCWFAVCAGILGRHSAYIPPLIIGFGGIVNYGWQKWLKKFSSSANQELQADNEADSIEISPSPLEQSNSLTEMEKSQQNARNRSAPVLSSMRTSIISLTLFFTFLITSFILLYTVPSTAAGYAFKVISSMYIAGSIIVGGGAVLVPSLQSYVVTPGWMTIDDFLFGIAIINILPGPNFNFAAYCAGMSLYKLLGNEQKDAQAVIITVFGCFLGYFGIFFPGLSVKVGILPLWKYMRRSQNIKIILEGVSSCAVGLVFSSVATLWFDAFSNNNSTDKLAYYSIISITAFVGIAYLKVHPILMVSFGAAMGGLSLLLFRE